MSDRPWRGRVSWKEQCWSLEPSEMADGLCLCAAIVQGVWKNAPAPPHIDRWTDTRGVYVAQEIASALWCSPLYHPTWTLAQSNCWVNMADEWIYLFYFIGWGLLVYYNWLLESFLHILNLWIWASRRGLMKPGLHNRLFNFDVSGLSVKGQLQRQWVILRSFMWW